MTANRYLIVNADDFGQSLGINLGVIEAYELGIVTSASLMVRWPAAVDAGRYARENNDLSIGLHLEFGEWAFKDGRWTALYEVVPSKDERAVKEEIMRQLDLFDKRVGKAPTHIDSHQSCHLREPIRSITSEIAQNLKVPLRSCIPMVTHFDGFNGQGQHGTSSREQFRVESFTKILSYLPAGITEIGCSPGLDDDLDSSCQWEREVELRTLCDPRVHDAIRELRITLCSFSDVNQMLRAELASV